MTIENLGFRIVGHQVRHDNGAARPATNIELQLWDALLRVGKSSGGDGDERNPPEAGADTGA